MLYGDGGNDTFVHSGNDGWDSYYGGADFDKIVVNQVSPYANWGQIKISYLDGVELIENNDTTKAVDILVDGAIDFSGTQISGIRHILGQNNDDSIIGSDDANVLIGNGGDDRLEGGGGNDILQGGIGADQFVFSQDQSVDIVTDFTDGADMLLFSGATSLQLFDYNGSAALELNGDTYVVLSGVDVSLIDGSDISFI